MWYYSVEIDGLNWIVVYLLAFVDRLFGGIFVFCNRSTVIVRVGRNYCWTFEFY